MASLQSTEARVAPEMPYIYIHISCQSESATVPAATLDLKWRCLNAMQAIHKYHLEGH